MRRRYLLTTWAASIAGARIASAQDPDLSIELYGRRKTYIAIPDFRGKNAASALLDVFNATVWDDIEEAGILEMVSKSKYPLETPPAISDVKLPEWAGAPVETDYLAVGNADQTTARDFIVRGWLLNVKLADAKTGPLLFRDYFGPPTPEGARKVGHEYAADILSKLGVKSLAGSKIYFVSTRSGHKEIWSMDYDGQNQQRMTGHNSVAISMPAVSPDGKLVAYAWIDPARSVWTMSMIDTVTRRPRSFSGPTSSMLGNPEFSPDGKSLWFSMPINDYSQIVRTSIDGSGLRRVSEVRAIDLSPRINPKTGQEVLFISGRSGTSQLYRMKIDGTGVERITDGTGEAGYPAWSPDGRRIAFAWTRGFEPGNFNIFVMNANDPGSLAQLTSRNGSNEMPWWAPDGVHLVYSNTQRGQDKQIYTMLANGRRAKKLTSAGDNMQPVWVAGAE